VVRQRRAHQLRHGLLDTIVLSWVVTPIAKSIIPSGLDLIFQVYSIVTWGSNRVYDHELQHLSLSQLDGDSATYVGLQALI
jgi:hypothetical protein